jgi:hypothetical protein
MTNTYETTKAYIHIDKVTLSDDIATIHMDSVSWERVVQLLEEQHLLQEKYSVYRTVKDRLFRALFSEKSELLSLYNALSGKSYTDPELLEIVTLNGAIYMGMKNDLSFLISSNLYLYEHQSTDNPNIPLRDLFYIAEQYRVMTVNADIYSSKKIGLPTPHFVVLYNGIEEKPDEFVYRLSDAYEVKEEDYDLDLRVRVVNVNKGHNTALMEKCKTLQEYSQFVDILRKYSKDFPSEQATHMAIDDCIEHDILRDYLLKNRAEVIAMVLYEFDIEKYKQQQEDKITLLQDTVQKQQLTLQQQQNDFHDALQQKDNDLKVQAQQIDDMSQRIKELEKQLAQIQ